MGGLTIILRMIVDSVFRKTVERDIKNFYEIQVTSGLIEASSGPHRGSTLRPHCVGLFPGAIVRELKTWDSTAGGSLGGSSGVIGVPL